MSNEHEYDISIGKDQWIIFGDLGDDQANAFEIDVLMTSLLSMWKALETECVSACCGIDAFDLWQDDVLSNTTEFDHVKLIRELSKLKTEVAELENEVLVSSTLNNYFSKTTFLQILDHLLKVYKNA
jgi:hypothetical protein